MALLNAVLPRLDEARLPDSNWCRFGGDTDNIDSPSNLRLLGGVHLKPASPSTSSTDRSRVADESISEATPVSISASHTSAARSMTLIGEASLPSFVGFLGENSDAVPSLSVPSPATPLANLSTTAVVSTRGVSPAAPDEAPPSPDETHHAHAALTHVAQHCTQNVPWSHVPKLQFQKMWTWISSGAPCRAREG